MSKLFEINLASEEFKEIWQDSVDFFFVYIHKKTSERQRRKIILTVTKIYKTKKTFIENWFTRAESSIQNTQFTDANIFYADVKKLLLNIFVELAYRK